MPEEALVAALRPDEDVEYVRRAVDRFADRLSAVVDRYRDVLTEREWDTLSHLLERFYAHHVE